MTHTPTPWRTRKNEKECPDDLVVMLGDGSHLDGISIADFAPCSPDITFEEAKASAARTVAALGFFHGRDIPTERIAAGGFWEMVDLLKRANLSLKLNAPMQAQGRIKELNDMLAKLGVESDG